jgi:hypothetical protein
MYIIFLGGLKISPDPTRLMMNYILIIINYKLINI